MSMYEGPHVKIYDSVLDELLNSPGGQVGRNLMRRIGLEIRTGARALVGVETGRLRESIYIQHGRRGRYQYVQVGSNVRYAYLHHEGERPHIIVPNSGRVLRFNVRGRVVYAEKVHHPGYRGRKYLTIPMNRAVRR